MNKIFLFAFALVLSSAVDAKQILENTEMAFDIDGWDIWSGDALVHYSEDGHFTPNGAALITGQVEGVAAIAATCIDVSEWVYFSRFKAEASVRPTSGADENSMGGISIIHYSNAACRDEIDTVTESRDAAPGEWTAINGDFSLLEGTEGIRIVIYATGVPNNGSTQFDDVSLTINREAEEIFENSDMTENTNGWLLYWGTHVEHSETDGHLTPKGSIRTKGEAPRTGSRGAFTGVRGQCVDITDRAPLDQFRVAASARPDASAIDPEMGIHVDYHSNTDCSSMFSRSLFFGEATAGQWSRLEGTFIPPQETKAILVIVRSSGVAENGGANFDDISLSLTQAVRQLWLIGVGEISEQHIKPVDMQYTRGGAFGGDFDPTTLGKESLANLEVDFDGCNSGQITYKGEGSEGTYRIFRLATNEAVEACEEQGFENMGENNGWMSGYWYGGQEREGEGFVFDVLAGSEQVIVTWYTYLPTWGVDAPR